MHGSGRLQLTARDLLVPARRSGREIVHMHRLVDLQRVHVHDVDVRLLADLQRCNGDAFQVSETRSATNRESFAILLPRSYSPYLFERASVPRERKETHEQTRRASGSHVGRVPGLLLHGELDRQLRPAHAVPDPER